MIIINIHTKFSNHMASMPINDRPLIKQIMLIGFMSAKFCFYGVNVVHFSNDHNVVSSINCRC